jgi:hypothetical protein
VDKHVFSVLLSINAQNYRRKLSLLHQGFDFSVLCPTPTGDVISTPPQIQISEPAIPIRKVAFSKSC